MFYTCMPMAMFVLMAVRMAMCMCMLYVLSHNWTSFGFGGDFVRTSLAVEAAVLLQLPAATLPVLSVLR